MKLSRLFLACSLLAAAAADSQLVREPDEFKRQVVPIIRKFIFSNYEKFSASELTFRHLKTHVSDTLSIPYETLKRDDLSEVIESATDEIANECNMGDVQINECKRRIGFTDEDGRTAKKEL